VKPDGAVLIALRTKSTVIKPTKKWSEADLLPLVDLLSTARPIEPLSPAAAAAPAPASTSPSPEDASASNAAAASSSSAAAAAAASAEHDDSDEDAISSSVPLVQLTARVFREAGRKMHQLGLPPALPPQPPLEGLLDTCGGAGGNGVPREPSPNWVTRLDFSGSKFGSNGAELLAHLLATNETIRDLNISNCRIGPRGFVAIARALVTNRTLERLDMHSNNCYAEHAKIFARALSQGGHGLRFLDMNNCSMSFEGCMAISRVIDKLNERRSHLKMQPQPRLECACLHWPPGFHAK